MNKTKSSSVTTMMMLSAMVMVSLLSVSLLSEKDAEATICFDCPDANEHLDEAKKSLDSVIYKEQKNILMQQKDYWKIPLTNKLN
jgi:hypothetical protein